MVPPASWELHVKRIPEGLVFRLQLVKFGFEEDFNEIIWPESMAFECEMSVRRQEEQQMSSPSIFRELVKKEKVACLSM
jgi:hypothetical protein